MQCQWNTERVSYFHQGSQHWESWNNQKLGDHHRSKTRSAYQATALDKLGVSPQKPDTERMSSYRFRCKNASPCNARGTRSAYPTCIRVASIRSPGTPKMGESPQRQDTGHVSSYRFRHKPLPAHAMAMEQGALVPQPPWYPAFSLKSQQRHISKLQ